MSERADVDKELDRLREKLSQEQMLSDRLFRALDNVQLFPGWRELRNEYLAVRGWPVMRNAPGGDTP